jgi:hypothetical protein
LVVVDVLKLVYWRMVDRRERDALTHRLSLAV